MENEATQPETSEVEFQMRRDWNARAEEDAHFYVAFGRQQQDNEEFFATASEVVTGLEWEMKRLPPANPRARRALEIGCGPGRLLRPMSRHFGEIHGVDVSDRMIARARANLAGIPHAHAHPTTGSDLAPFADESFDFVYSYAVFQHIPSAEVVRRYWQEAWRVMKPGAIARLQINGLPKEQAGGYNTWSGVRFSADEIRTFTREQGFQLFGLEGANTQYMWTTWRKPGPTSTRSAVAAPRIRRITNSHSSEPVAPPIGRYASITIWMETLPDQADLHTLQILIGGRPAFASYIGPRERDGLQQLNVLIPPGTRTGVQPLEIRWCDDLLCPPSHIRIIPPGPQVPRLRSVTDGIDLLSGQVIVSGTIKVTLEEIQEPRSVRAFLDHCQIDRVEVFCADPLPPRYEINLFLPPGFPPGPYNLRLQLDARVIGPVGVHVRPSTN
jgi:SAM-dependent methyltransferase